MPPLSPTPSDLTVSVPLTNVAIAWKRQRREDFVADRIFPIVPVPNQGGKYWKFHRPDWRRTRAQVRAPSTESVGIAWRVTTDVYFADVFAVHADIDDRQRANADSIFRLDRTFTEQVMNDLHLRREKDWNAAYNVAGVWGRDLTGVTATPGADEFIKFSETASTPIEDFRAYRRAFKRISGLDPNGLVMGPAVEDTLLDHDAIIERIKYTQRGVVSRDLLASFLDVGTIYVPEAVEVTNEEMDDLQADADNAEYEFIGNEDSMLLLHTTNAPSRENPSAGYIFSWSGLIGSSREGIRTKKFRQEEIASDRIEGEMAYDMRVTAPELGWYFADVV